MLLRDARLTAELTELRTGDPLPTSAAASFEEGESVCMKRARSLVDLYREGLTRSLR